MPCARHDYPLVAGLGFKGDADHTTPGRVTAVHQGHHVSLPLWAMCTVIAGCLMCHVHGPTRSHSTGAIWSHTLSLRVDLPDGAWSRCGTCEHRLLQSMAHSASKGSAACPRIADWLSAALRAASKVGERPS